MLSCEWNKDPMFSLLFGKPTGCRGRFAREEPVQRWTDVRILVSGSRSPGADMRLTAALWQRPGAADHKQPLQRFSYIEPTHLSSRMQCRLRRQRKRQTCLCSKAQRVCLFCVQRRGRQDESRVEEGNPLKKRSFFKFL